MTNIWNQDIREVVQLPKWQELRKQFIGTWMKQPEENVKRLREFLGNIQEVDDRKLRIVYNYLTGSGFRTKQISHPSIDALLAQVREEVRRRKEKVYGND